MPKKYVSTLESHIGYLMRLVSNSVSGDFANKMNNTGVTIAEWVTMRIMFDHHQITHSQIVEISGLTKGAITKTLNKLLDKKLIEKNESKSDGRSQTLRLSQNGLKILPLLANLADKNDEEYFSILKIEEQVFLKKILRKIIQVKGITGTPTD
jgi:DNA-binding MarR family transcriptional regulator